MAATEAHSRDGSNLEDLTSALAAASIHQKRIPHTITVPGDNTHLTRILNPASQHGSFSHEELAALLQDMTDDDQVLPVTLGTIAALLNALRKISVEKSGGTESVISQVRGIDSKYIGLKPFCSSKFHYIHILLDAVDLDYFLLDSVVARIHNHPEQALFRDEDGVAILAHKRQAEQLWEKHFHAGTTKGGVLGNKWASVDLVAAARRQPELRWMVAQLVTTKSEIQKLILLQAGTQQSTLVPQTRNSLAALVSLLERTGDPMANVASLLGPDGAAIMQNTDSAAAEKNVMLDVKVLRCFVAWRTYNHTQSAHSSFIYYANVLFPEQYPGHTWRTGLSPSASESKHTETAGHPDGAITASTSMVMLSTSADKSDASSTEFPSPAHVRGSGLLGGPGRVQLVPLTETRTVHDIIVKVIVLTINAYNRKRYPQRNVKEYSTDMSMDGSLYIDASASESDIEAKFVFFNLGKYLQRVDQFVALLNASSHDVTEADAFTYWVRVAGREGFVAAPVTTYASTSRHGATIKAPFLRQLETAMSSFDVVAGINPFGRFSDDTVHVYCEDNDGRNRIVEYLQDKYRSRYRVQFLDSLPTGVDEYIIFQASVPFLLVVFQGPTDTNPARPKDTFTEPPHVDEQFEWFVNEPVVSESYAVLTGRSLVERGNTASIMNGTAAGDLARVLADADPTSQRYEWLHRLAVGLIGATAADKSTNLLCGTEYANSVMIYYERFATGALAASSTDNSPIVHTLVGYNGSAPTGAIKFAPPFLQYTVLAADQSILAQGVIDMQFAFQPSQWCNAVIDALLAVGTVDPPIPSDSPEPEPASLKAFTMSTATRRFVALAADSTESDAFVFDSATIKRLLGISTVEDLHDMSLDDKNAFYREALTADTDAHTVFNAPSTMPAADVVKVATTTIHGLSCRLRMYFNSVSNIVLADLTPQTGSSFVSKFFPDTMHGNFKERLVLMVSDLQNPSSSRLRIALKMNVAAVFSFIPNIDKAGVDEIEVFGDFGYNTSTFAFDVNSSITAWATTGVDTSITIADNFSITNLTLGFSTVRVVESLPKGQFQTRRVLSPFCGALATWNITGSQDAPTTFGLRIGLRDVSKASSVYFLGFLDHLLLPFGDIEVEQVQIQLIDLTSFNASLSMQIAAPDLEISFDGNFSKAMGFDMIAVLSAPSLSTNDLMRLHKTSTASKDLLPTPKDPALTNDVHFKQVTVQYSSAETPIPGMTGKSAPPGLTLSAQMDFDEKSFSVILSMSKKDGITIEGLVGNVSLGPLLTLDEVDLKAHIASSQSAADVGSYIQGSVQFSFDLPGHSQIEVDLLARFGKDKFGIAQLSNDTSFGLGSFDSSLDFLNFSFPSLYFAYSAAAQDVTVPVSASTQTQTQQLSLPQGKTIFGVVEFELLKTFFGVDVPFGFEYAFGSEGKDATFKLSPGQAPKAVSVKRFSAPEKDGFLLQLDIVPTAQLVVGFRSSMSVLGHHGTVLGGFKVAKVGEILSASVFGEVKAADGDDGFPLSVPSTRTGTPGVRLLDVALQAEVFPTPGALALEGKIKFGKDATAQVAIQFAEIPEDDAFYIELAHATLSDVLTLNAQLIGFSLDIPVLDKIKINDLVLYWAPEGLTIADISVMGFGFKADLEFFGVRLFAAVIVDEKNATWHLEARCDPLRVLGGALALTGFDGSAGPMVVFDGSPTRSEFVLDCALKLVFVSARAKVHIVAAVTKSLIDMDIEYNILGLRTVITANGSEEDATLKVTFSLSAGQRRQVKEETIKKIKAAARQMQKDAEAVAADGEQAIAAYNQGLTQLEDDLTAAQTSFDNFVATLHSDIDGETTALDKLIHDTEAAHASIEKDLQTNATKLQDDLSDAAKKLETDRAALQVQIQQFETDLEHTRTDSKQRITDANTHFKTNMDKAHNDVTAATNAKKDADSQLKTIEAAKPPSGRGCSSKDKHRWERRVADAKKKLKSAGDNLTKAGQVVDATQRTHDENIRKLEADRDQRIEVLTGDIGRLRTQSDRLQQDIDVLKSPPDLTKLKELQATVQELADQISKKERLKHQQSAALANATMLKKKADLDVQHNQAYIETMEAKPTSTSRPAEPPIVVAVASVAAGKRTADVLPVSAAAITTTAVEPLDDELRLVDTEDVHANAIVRNAGFAGNLSVRRKYVAGQVGADLYFPLRDSTNPSHDVILKISHGRPVGYYRKGGRYFNRTTIEGRTFVFEGQGGVRAVVDPLEAPPFTDLSALMASGDDPRAVSDPTAVSDPSPAGNGFRLANAVGAGAEDIIRQHHFKSILSISSVYTAGMFAHDMYFPLRNSTNPLNDVILKTSRGVPVGYYRGGGRYFDTTTIENDMFVFTGQRGEQVIIDPHVPPPYTDIATLIDSEELTTPVHFAAYEAAIALPLDGVAELLHTVTSVLCNDTSFATSVQLAIQTLKASNGEEKLSAKLPKKVYAMLSSNSAGQKILEGIDNVVTAIEPELEDALHMLESASRYCAFIGSKLDTPEKIRAHLTLGTSAHDTWKNFQEVLDAISFCERLPSGDIVGVLQSIVNSAKTHFGQLVEQYGHAFVSYIKSLVARGLNLFADSLLATPMKLLQQSVTALSASVLEKQIPNLMDITDKVSSTISKLMAHRLTTVGEKLVSQTQLDSAKAQHPQFVQAASDAADAYTATEHTYDQRITQLDKEISGLMKQKSSAEAAVATEQQRILSQNKVLQALVDAENAEHTLQQTIASQKTHLQDLKDTADDGYTTAANLRNQNLTSAAKSRRDDAKSAVDTWKSSDLAHLAHAAATDVQTAAMDARKAVAIYEEMSKKQSTAFLEISASVDWDGKEGNLDFAFSFNFSFSLHIDLGIFPPIDIDFSITLHAEVDLGALMEIANNAFTYIWKEIKKKL
eukprot:m.1577274 g.1577274  ORF g.1577274 m.1577274 type:complete len:2882 (-) comp25310_c0_seq2:1556-10201(-)